MKKWLLEANRNWVDELPNVLWTLRTMPKASTGEIPFRMTYGTEAVLPVEISSKSLRIEKFDPKSYEEGLKLNVDLLEELRNSTQANVSKYQEKVAKLYNSKVKPRSFQVNDLVLREAATSMPSKQNKMSPPWEGPYRVTKVINSSFYRLEHLDGTSVTNAWNAIHLKKFYP